MKKINSACKLWNHADDEALHIMMGRPIRLSVTCYNIFVLLHVLFLRSHVLLELIWRTTRKVGCIDLFRCLFTLTSWAHCRGGFCVVFGLVLRGIIVKLVDELLLRKAFTIACLTVSIENWTAALCILSWREMRHVTVGFIKVPFPVP